MSLPALYKVPEDQDGWAAWAFNHAAIHMTVNGAVSTQKSQNLTQYMLDAVDPEDLGMWLYQHQATHNQVNAVLGINGYDLTNLNWRDKDQFEWWLQLNGEEHQKWNEILGV